MTWEESNSTFPKHFPQKTAGGLKIELTLLEFQRKSSARLSNEIVKTLEKCVELYNKMHLTHNKFQIPSTSKIKYFLDKEKHPKLYQYRLLKMRNTF